MEEIIKPVSKELLKAELTEDKRLRMTNKSNNQIYIITAQDSPNTMKEIGRLREIAFRAAGGGTGMSMDIDEYDIMDNPYKQLIVWNPEEEEILGGYRYILGSESVDLKAFSKTFHETLGGKGGGKGEMVQGTVNASEETIRNYIEKK